MAVDPIIAAAGISAGSNLLGGLMGGDDGHSYSKQFKWNMRTLRHQLAYQSQWNLHDARTRPSHMVSGAKRAGIHPALLFGGSAMSAPTWSIGGLDVAGPSASGGSSWGDSFRSFGQDLSRAIMSNLSREERANELKVLQERQSKLDALNLERHALDVQHMGLQNALLASQLQRLNQQAGPPAPSTADVVITPYDPNKQTGTQVGRWEVAPASVISASHEMPSVSAGPPEPGFKKYRFGGKHTGWTSELPYGNSLSESLESMGGAVAPLYVWGHNIARWLDDLKKPDGSYFIKRREERR